MGILNVTPDSFYDGGFHHTKDTAVNRVRMMLKEGATFIDVGGYSSRPDAIDISVEEEIERVLPVIVALIKEFPEIVISIDTFRASVAEKAVQAGAAMINDISAGLLDSAMLKMASDLGVPYVMMHMRGTPQTMKNHIAYENISKEMIYYFSERVAAARNAGIRDLLIDPGFGFAKTKAQNFEVLSQLELLHHLNIPMLVGVSRKSMIYKTLEVSSSQALNGTTALNMVALQKGARILRVHDVKEAHECIQLYSALS